MSPEEKKKDLLYQIMYDATKEKFSILPTLSGIMLAVLALGVSGGLFEINTTIKFIATALLLLMILSLQVYYSSTIETLIEAKTKLYECLGKDNDDLSMTFLQSMKYLFTGKIGNKTEKDFFKRFSSQFPALALLIIWVVVFLIITEIWF